MKKLLLVVFSFFLIPQIGNGINLPWKTWLNMWPELEATFQEESGLNPKAYNWDGGAEARGLAQITKKYHPEISDAQAYNPFFALAWSIDVWHKGNAAKEWTCYRQLFVQNKKDCK